MPRTWTSGGCNCRSSGSEREELAGTPGTKRSSNRSAGSSGLPAATHGGIFRTIRPVPYPGRTPHIFVAVFREGDEPYVTQLYVKGEPRNSTDFLFARIPPERRELVTAAFMPVSRGEAEREAVFDIVSAGRDGTPAG